MKSFFAKSNKVKSLIFAACAGAFALPAAAETISLAVPFAFTASGKTFPAGTYSLESSGGVVMLRGSGAAVFFNTEPSNSGEATANASVVFSDEALKAVKFPNGMTQSVIPDPLGIVLAKH